MKNSAPVLSAKGKATMSPTPAISVREASSRSRLAVIVSASTRASSAVSSSAWACFFVRASITPRA